MLEPTLFPISDLSDWIANLTLTHTLTLCCYLVVSSAADVLFIYMMS